MLLDLVGGHPQRSAIDSVHFGVAGRIIAPPELLPIPLPAELPLLLEALGLLGLQRLRRKG